VKTPCVVIYFRRENTKNTLGSCYTRGNDWEGPTTSSSSFSLPIFAVLMSGSS